MAGRPNVIVILMDDMGWMDLSCQGSTFYQTPHIDRLAFEGVRMTDGYASAPISSPTRASLMTGKCPARVGITNWIGGESCGRLLDVPYRHELPLEEFSIARAMKQGGYQNWYVGKWHLGGEGYGPLEHGFDVNIGGHHFGLPPNGYFAPWQIPSLREGADGEYLTDRLTDEAMALIGARDTDQPFYLQLSYYAVHTPIQAKAELIEKYRRRAREMGLDRVEAFEEGEYFPCRHKADQRVVRRLVQSDPAYAAMIETVDTNVGRLMKCLKDQRIDEQTVVIFTSDNGGLSTAEGSPTCNAPLSEGKGWHFEGGDRVPWLVRWPGRIEAGRVDRTPVYTPDLYPTLLALAGLELMPEQHCDGVDLSGLLLDRTLLADRPLFFHYPHYSNQGGRPSAMMRLGDWKLIRWYEDERYQLFNLREDLSETRDLANTQPQRVQSMSALLNDWLQEVGALIPAPNPAWSG